ncbi:hypothetical protein ACTXT7_000174 [Hymenolepis weldensis]
MEDEEFSFYQASVVDRDVLDVIKSVEAPSSFNPEPDVISQVMTLLRNAVVLTDITPAKLLKILKERLYPKREVCLFCSQNPSVRINLGAQKRRSFLISRLPVNYSEIVLREFAEKLNSVTPDEPPINVLNEVDSEMQLGRKIPLTIFRTSNGRGWGIKTPQRIPKGTFVIEYVGEIHFPFCQIISINEALRRGELYDRENQTYLFEADYDLPSQFAIDNCHKGNASRFINHSQCEPNLIIHHVFIDGANPKLPRIAFFARRNIKEGEELTIDYQLQLLDTGSIEKVDSSKDIKTWKVQSFTKHVKV